jgi:serine/threonine-protein kinase
MIDADPRSGDDGAGRRFRIVRTLGEGSFGAVYLAEMESAGGFKRRVALKMLHRTWDPESDAGRRLRDEARLLGRLQHRHIVRVDDLLRLDGQWALLMEYLPGADLETVFGVLQTEQGRIPPRAALEMVAAVASALDAATSAPGEDGGPLNVVHRDIKPSNIRLSANGELKVLDFGVARAQFAGRESKTEQVRYGSLGYMAPERLLGGEETASGDVYAVGVLLYELLTLSGYGRAELGADAQAAQVARAREALANLAGPALADLASRALSYEPTVRPTASEVERGLRALLRDADGADLAAFAAVEIPRIAGPEAGTEPHGRVLAETTSAPPGSQVASGTLVVPLPPPEPSRAAPRGPKMVGVAAVVGLLAVAGAAWIVWPGPGPEPDDPIAAPLPAVEVPPPPVAVPEIEPEVAPAPAEPEAAVARPGRPSASPTPVTPAVATPPPAPQPAPQPPPESAPPATRLRSAKFGLAGAEGLTVSCGDVSGTGQTSVLLREFPAGKCTVRAAGASTTVTVEAPRGVDCTFEGSVLQCR